ncbi:hypothetical protein [Saccharopolyspora sp. 6T]|nr:hypothetical protein [Saccharopolyspora sp. 6T]
MFERSKVADVTRDDGEVVVSTDRGEVRADKVALATNAYSRE